MSLSPLVLVMQPTLVDESVQLHFRRQHLYPRCSEQSSNTRPRRKAGRIRVGGIAEELRVPKAKMRCCRCLPEAAKVTSQTPTTLHLTSTVGGPSSFTTLPSLT